MTDPAVLAARERIGDWFRTALDAVEPAAAVRRHLGRDGAALVVGGRRVPVGGRLLVAGVGKAVVAMARGAEEACGDLLTGGLAITKDGHLAPPLPGLVRVVEAAHPIPDGRGVVATRELLAMVGGVERGDVVLALVSGGGSALMEAPRPPVSLADLAVTTDLLLRAGAPIDDLNAVRVPLSLVKGGGLRAAGAPATWVTLILSDVLGNDPRVIASGPTVPTGFRAADALAVLRRYRLSERVPGTVLEALSAVGGDASRGPAPTAEGVARAPSAAGLGRVEDDVVALVGDNATAVAACAATARGADLSTATVWADRRGEAADLGRAWVGVCAAASPRVEALFGGGEATVTVRGGGVGGRNTEFALSAALALEARGLDGWVVASLATDGQDGPTGVAGAVADAGTVQRAREAGVDPERALAENDSLAVFRAAGGVVEPGPTGTNVNDVYVAVRVGVVGGRG